MGASGVGPGSWESSGTTRSLPYLFTRGAIEGTMYLLAFRLVFDVIDQSLCLTLYWGPFGMLT